MKYHGQTIEAMEITYTETNGCWLCDFSLATFNCAGVQQTVGGELDFKGRQGSSTK